MSSTAFRGSRRCQQFFQYVVEETLQGRADRLKERCIGSAVFDLPPDYDTNENSIVRSKANEVRKRLAQYYVDSREVGEIRFQLPPGSYVPEFQCLRETEKEPPKTARARPRWLVPGALAPLGLLAVAAGLQWAPPTDAVSRFWGPLLENPQDLVICIGNSGVYRLGPGLSHRFNEVRGRYEPGYAAIPLPPDLEFRGSDLIPAPDSYAGIGALQATVAVSTLFSRRDRSTYIRTSNDVAFADLRRRPVVLIGAYSNRWTMQVTDGLRFHFFPQKLRILDRAGHRQWELEPGRGDLKVATDYAILARLRAPQTGEMMVVLAGLEHYGSQAAAEVATNPRYLSELLRDAPRNWPSINMQAVIQCKVTGKTPDPPKVIATHFW